MPRLFTRPSDRVVMPSPARVLGDINITPLIDVLLVLLIIFLAALPLTQKGLDAELPQTSPQQPPVADDTRVVAEYFAGGQLLINKQPVAMADAPRRFHEIFAARRDKTLFVMGDGAVAYGEIMAVIDAARAGGADRIGIVTGARSPRR